MEAQLLDLPSELLELVLLNVIARPWKNDVQDFLSLTSTCRTLYHFAKHEHYWKIMALRRDPYNDKPSENMTYLEYCQLVCLMRTIRSEELIDRVSRYNEKYFCTIEKVILWPHFIRVYIDERGDNSVGAIQHPSSSVLAFVDALPLNRARLRGHPTIGSHFSIEDKTRQYLGYLDFRSKFASTDNPINVAFQYGSSGYSSIILFHVDQAFLDRYNIHPLSNFLLFK